MNLKDTAVVASLALGLTAGTAQAALIININQVGSDVVAVGKGPLDFDGLSFGGEVFLIPVAVKGNTAYFATGQAATYVYEYNGISGPRQIGTGDSTFDITSYNGDTFAFSARKSALFVAPNLESGSFLGFDTTWAGATIASLGLTNGSYTYTFPNDSFTINIGDVSAVPLPASAPMFGAALLALAGFAYGTNRWVAPKNKKDAAAV